MDFRAYDLPRASWRPLRRRKAISAKGLECPPALVRGPPYSRFQARGARVRFVACRPDPVSGKRLEWGEPRGGVFLGRQPGGFPNRADVQRQGGPAAGFCRLCRVVTGGNQLAAQGKYGGPALGREPEGGRGAGTGQLDADHAGPNA
jgi:hypothetical protein